MIILLAILYFADCFVFSVLYSERHFEIVSVCDQGGKISQTSLGFWGKGCGTNNTYSS